MESQIRPWVTLKWTQTERTQVIQNTLMKKATGEKHIVCLYFSCNMHPISPTFIKLIFKTVNGSSVHDIKRKAIPVIYNTVNEKSLPYFCFGGLFFQLEIMFSSYRIFIDCK